MERLKEFVLELSKEIPMEPSTAILMEFSKEIPMERSIEEMLLEF